MTVQPEYAARAREMVRERRARPARDRSMNNRALNILLTAPFSDLLKRAAQQRKLNQSAYTRRALCIFIAHDLGVSLRSVLSMCAMPVSYAGRAAFIQGHIWDDGAGIESWCPHPGCDGAHLRAMFEADA